MAAMRTHQTELTTATTEVPGFADLTDEIQESLEASGIRDGQVTVFSPYAGCPLIVNERESGLLADLKTAMDRLGGAPARGRSVIGSNSVVMPAVNGELRLGTWQRLILVELEEATVRSVVVQIVGE